MDAVFGPDCFRCGLRCLLIGSAERVSQRTASLSALQRLGDVIAVIAFVRYHFAEKWGGSRPVGTASSTTTSSRFSEA